MVLRLLAGSRNRATYSFGRHGTAMSIGPVLRGVDRRLAQLPPNRIIHASLVAGFSTALTSRTASTVATEAIE